MRSARSVGDYRVEGAALDRILVRFLSDLVRFTPGGQRLEISARTLRRDGGRGTWAEVGVRSAGARLGNARLSRLLKAIGPMKLADVVTDLHRGELRVTVLSRVTRLADGWFVIRQGARGVPLFAIICRAER
ncbi:MAG: hypothetical protein HY700_05195 [Gemmatimonadetes bacterium]|nr:hypothetical protein [Gemmatimonadota bacterium]